jgi:pimeloyl-ACP methyl ester carboxylesterase
MTTVFVHGVPDTAAVWSRLKDEIVPAVPGERSVALALPGFGCELPAGFDCSKEAYVAWLMAAVEDIPPPRDLIAHDWGSILAMRAISVRPDLVRSWVAGGAPSTPGYTWHPTARLWQTPGAGEKAMERLTGQLAIDMLGRAGLDAATAAETAARIDARMKAAILALYRSGRDVFETWGLHSRSQVRYPPGLVLWGERDPYAGPAFAFRLGEATGATVRVLECGHWWQLEQPQAAAAEIVAFRRVIGA